MIRPRWRQLGWDIIIDRYGRGSTEHSLRRVQRRRTLTSSHGHQRFRRRRRSYRHVPSLCLCIGSYAVFPLPPRCFRRRCGWRRLRRQGAPLCSSRSQTRDLLWKNRYLAGRRRRSRLELRVACPSGKLKFRRRHHWRGGGRRQG